MAKSGQNLAAVPQQALVDRLSYAVLLLARVTSCCDSRFSNLLLFYSKYLEDEEKQ